MRISDWSSDVCSADLFRHQFFGTARLAYRDGGHAFGHAGHAESPAFTMSHSGRLIDRPGARVNSSRLRNAGTSEKGHAMDDDDLPRRQGGALAALTREPLDPMSVDELDDRIAALEAEIARSEEHTSELQSLMRISYASFCLK